MKWVPLALAGARFFSLAPRRGEGGVRGGFLHVPSGISLKHMRWIGYDIGSVP